MRHLLFVVAMLPAVFGAIPLQAQEKKTVLSEDFKRFDKKNRDDFGRAPDAVEIVDGGRVARPTGSSGRSGKCVKITATLGKNTGAHLYRALKPGPDVRHLRFHVKFEKEHDYLHLKANSDPAKSAANRRSGSTPMP